MYIQGSTSIVSVGISAVLGCIVKWWCSSCNGHDTGKVPLCVYMYMYLDNTGENKAVPSNLVISNGKQILVFVSSNILEKRE